MCIIFEQLGSNMCIQFYVLIVSFKNVYYSLSISKCLVPYLSCFLKDTFRKIYCFVIYEKK